MVLRRRWVVTASVLVAVVSLCSPVAEAAPGTMPHITRITPSIGSVDGGQYVTLYGNFLYSTRTVVFGTTKARIVENRTAHRVVVAAPRHSAGSVQVRVTTPVGTGSAGRYTFVLLPQIASASPMNGRVNVHQFVTLTGRHLTPARRVMFGLNRAHVLSARPDRIEVSAPTGTDHGVVDVTVTTDQGTASAGRYRYYETPSIREVIDSGHSGSIDGGSYINVDGTGFGDATTVTIGGRRATIDRIAEAKDDYLERFDSITVLTPPGVAGLADVVVSNGHASDTLADGYRYAHDPTSTYDHGIPLDPVRGSPVAVSCPDSSHCVVIDANGWVMTSTDGTWSQPRLLDISAQSMHQVTDLDCPTITFCAATGYLFVWTFDPGAAGGDRWQYVGAEPTSVACASGVFCIAGGDGTWTWNGRTWARETRFDARSVACSAGSCIAFSPFGSAQVSPRGVVRRLPAGVGERASCAPDICRAVSALAGYRTTVLRDGTMSFQDPSMLFRDVACVAPHWCLAVGDRRASYFDGESWSSPVAVAAHHTLTGVACALADGNPRCTAVDDAGGAYDYRNGQWSSPVLIDRPRFGVSSLACPTTTTCVALDAAGWVLHLADGRWSEPAALTPPPDPSDGLFIGPLKTVSCGTATFCFASGTAGVWSSTDGGATWHRESITGRVTCARERWCIAVDGSTYRVNDGLFWGPPQPIGDDIQPSSTTCPQRGFCLAYSYAPEYDYGVVRFDGSAWTRERALPPAPETHPPIACGSVNSCIVFGAREGVRGSAPVTYRYESGEWRTEPHFGEPRVDEIDCPSASFCLAAGTDAFELVEGTWHRWSFPMAPADPSTGPTRTGVRAISCPTSQKCYLITDDRVVTVRR